MIALHIEREYTQNIQLQYTANPTGKTLVQALWTVIVISGFLAASKLIYDSFLDWSEAPVGTSEETFSVEKMSFPKLTVCPPNGTHTALNYDLQKLANKTLKHSL